MDRKSSTDLGQTQACKEPPASSQNSVIIGKHGADVQPTAPMKASIPASTDPSFAPNELIICHKRPKTSKLTRHRKTAAEKHCWEIGPLHQHKIPAMQMLVGINYLLRVHLHCNNCSSKQHFLLSTGWLAQVLLAALLQQNGAGGGHSSMSCQHTADCYTARAEADRTAAVPAGELRRPTETHRLAKVKYLNLKHGNF